MTHHNTHKHATVAAVALLRAIVQLLISERYSEYLGHAVRCDFALVVVAAPHGIVVECDAVERGDQEKRPVGTSFGLLDVAVVVDRKEDVRDAFEAGEC